MKWLKLVLIVLITIGIVGAVAFYFLVPAAVTTVATFQGGNTPSPAYVPDQVNTAGNPVQTAAAQNAPSAEMQLSPTELAKGFYAWYLGGLIKDYKFGSSKDFSSSVGNWLTPRFSASWRSLAAGTGSDPFTFTQDYQNSWATDIATSIASQSATSSAILVTLGGSSDSQSQKVTANLVLADGTWRIDSVTSAPFTR